MLLLCGATLVIPGQAEGLSPEPITAELARSGTTAGAPLTAEPVFMGSGLFAARSPGMTAVFSDRPNRL